MSNFIGSPLSGFQDGIFSDVRFNFPREIVFMTSKTVLVADERNNRLRLLDLKTNSSSSVCSGEFGNQLSIGSSSLIADKARHSLCWHGVSKSDKLKVCGIQR